MPAELFIIVLRFSLMGYSGDVLPDDQRFRRPFAQASECWRHVPEVQASLANVKLPVAPDRIYCARLAQPK